jgi:hypothetical protein
MKPLLIAFVSLVSCASIVAQTGSGSAPSSYYFPYFYWAHGSIPSGGVLRISIQSHGGYAGVVSESTVRVADAANVAVWQGPPVMATIPAVGVHTMSFPGTDSFGNPLAPGTYQVQAEMVPGMWFSIVNFDWDSSPASESSTELPFWPMLGSTRVAMFQSPLDAGRPYIFAVSLGSSIGIATCGGVVPLDNDPLFAYCLGPMNSVVSPLVGVLDAAGCTNSALAPHLVFPADPAVSGWTVHGCFVVLDLNAPCPVRRIGGDLVMQLYGP